MHVEVVVGAVAKELAAARPKSVAGDVLLGRRGGCLVQVIVDMRGPFASRDSRDSDSSSSFDYSGRYQA